ncbi:MAG: ornithine cyclodeaminase family protein [Myxococcales bacterium]|nr:ornithine cyclodeaminase family protein [Myxococcales bacterium]
MAQGPVFLTAADCQRLLSHLDVVAQIERALAWDAAGTIEWPTPRSLNIIGDKWGNDFHVKMCVLDSVPVGGIRVVSHPLDESSPVNTRLILLVDPTTAWPLALIDESWSYVQRTVGSIAMAARHLANPDAATLAIVGAGRLARTAAEYYSRLFSLQEIRVASRTSARRDETVAALSAKLAGVPVRSADSIEAAVRGADLVLTATSATTALLEDAWVGPGAVVACVGTAEPGRELLERADLFVVDNRDQLRKELIAEYGEGSPDWIDATVLEIVTGKHPGRTDQAQRAVLVTEGIASQDIALAYLAYQRAREAGVGLELPFGAAAPGFEQP